ncbi:MAG: xanthine dehydrogenase small subunit [Sandaracinaceae bacterium]
MTLSATTASADEGAPAVSRGSSDALRFTLNGRAIDATGADPNTTLLGWLREHGYTGSKEGCAEGECGACAVAFVRPDREGASRLVAVNGCLVLLGACAGQEIFTVEGIGAHGLHEVQRAMVELGGSQCGYCTPGFVVSLFAEFYRRGRKDEGFDLESIAGNLCRCTGYRPIRDAGRGLPMVREGDPFASRLSSPAPAASAFTYRTSRQRTFHRPTRLRDALAILAEHPDAAIVTGGTDLVVEMNQRHRRFDAILSLDAVEELKSFEETDEGLSIGAGVPLSEVEARTHDTLPIFGELFELFSSRLIRNRATLGGNLGTASPIGDSPPVLLCLDAIVDVDGPSGPRAIPIDALFTGYRTTQLTPGELIVRVRIAKPFPDVARFYKVSKRVHDDISCVAAGFSLRFDGGLVHTARLAYGGIAATPIRAIAAEEALVGKPWSARAVEDAKAKLSDAFTPMTDQRGSAAYRTAMITSLLDKLYSDTRDSQMRDSHPRETKVRDA